MITPSYGLTATERVLPRLALDWTTGLAQPGVDVTRAGVSTFVGSNGLIQSASINTQRVDWSTGTSGLLVEESRTNLALHSEDLTQQPPYVVFGTSVSANATTAPNGLTVADKLVEDNANSVHQIQQQLTFTAGVTYTFSFYAQQAGRSVIRMFENVRQGIEFAEFNLSTGVASSFGAISGWTLNGVSIKPAGEGFYRCIISATSPVDISNNAFFTRIRLSNGSSTTYQGDGTSGVYLWGFQLEAGAFPTSYIPTEATAVTRNADAARMTGTNFSDWFNASEGSFMSLVNSCAKLTDGTAVSMDSGNTNFIVQRFISNNGQLVVRTGGSVVVQIGAQSYSGSGPYQFCSSYKADDFSSATNGANFVTDTAGALPSVNTLRIGVYGSSASILNGHIAKFSYWPMQLTDAEIVAFSKG